MLNYIEQEGYYCAKQIFSPNRSYSCWDRGSERTTMAFSFSDSMALSRSRIGYHFQRHWLRVQERIILYPGCLFRGTTLYGRSRKTMAKTR